MSTRIVVNGRVAWANFNQRPQFIEKISPDKATPIVPPPGDPVKTVGTPFYDEDDDVFYRVVEYLDPRAGWLLADQVMRRYVVGYGTVLKLAKLGVIEPAVEKGSPTKRFRVRSDEMVRKTVAAMKKEIERASKRPYRRRGE